MLCGIRLLPLLLCVFISLLVRAEVSDSTSYAVSPPDVFLAGGVLVAPAKAAAESLGAVLKLEHKTITMTRGTVQVVYTINSTKATVDGAPSILPKAPFMASSRLYLPLASLVKAFHGTISVDQKAGYAITKQPDTKTTLHFPLIPLADWQEDNGDATNALYVINLDSTGLRRIICNAGMITAPAFSPDGARMVYIRNGNICLRHVEQADETRVLAGEASDYESPCFTPDGQYILYQRVIRKYDNKKPTTTEQIWRINPDGAGKRLLATGKRCSISADSRNIAYTTDGQMHVMDIDGGQQRTLGAGTNPVFSPDGSGLLYQKAFTVDKKTVKLLVARKLTEAEPSSLPTPTQESTNEHESRFSPDGQHILYLADGLAIMKPDRSDVVRLTTNARDASPVFTSDGQTIVFRRNESLLSLFDDDDDAPDFLGESIIMSIKPDGSQELDITTGIDAQDFAVAPNGRQLVFISDTTQPPDNSKDPMQEAEPSYTEEVARGYVKDVMPLIEEITGRKYVTTPEIRLVKRRQLVPILTGEIAPQMRLILSNNALDINTLARMISKASMPAILGKYGLKDRVLYLLPGNFDPLMRATRLSQMHRDGMIKLIIAHELTHALHDQIVGLQDQLAKTTSLDQMMALGATSEGFAIYVQDAVAEKLRISSTTREMARMLAIAVTPGAPQSFVTQNGKNQMFRETYLGGRDFIDWHMQHADIEQLWKILAQPPRKTSMILHPEQYSVTTIAETDYMQVVTTIIDRLQLNKKKRVTLELGEIVLRELFNTMPAQKRDALSASISQAYMATGSKDDEDDDNAQASMMLVAFRDNTQISPFVTTIEESNRNGKINGDKQSSVAGITADYTHKRVMAIGERKETVISIARNNVLIMLNTTNYTLPDKEILTIIEDAFTQIDGIGGKAPNK